MLYHCCSLINIINFYIIQDMKNLLNQTRIQMRLKAAGMNIYSCYNNMMPPPPPPPRKVQ